MKRDHGASMEAVEAHTVLCCSCGVSMAPNQTMRCAQCLKAEVSIVDGISRQVVLPRCRNCGRWARPPWTKCEPESRELLGICLKRIKGVGKDVRLVDASFIWTEEHSLRIRVKITVQKEVANSSVLQQTMVVEFQVVNQQCEDCQKSFTPHTWSAMVQVRQKVSHRRTFCYLEQQILKADAHDKVLSLKETREGLDFHFGQRSHAQRFADFIQSCAPMRQKHSKHLVSHDANSNEYNYKYTVLCDVCPICVDDVVFCPKGHSQGLSGAAALMLCHKISNSVRLVDPLSNRGYDIANEHYWKRPVITVCTRERLTEYVVLNVEIHEEQPQAGSKPRHHVAGNGKLCMADIEIIRATDFGVNDERMIVRSHLGGALRPGNRALGYDLRTVNVSGYDGEGIEDFPSDIILVRRLYKKRRGKRAWDVKRIPRQRGDGEEVVDDDNDMEALRQDLEEDPELRRGVNMYRMEDEPGQKKANPPADQGAAEEDEEDELNPEVPLAELLEGLELRDDGPELPDGVGPPPAGAP